MGGGQWGRPSSCSGLKQAVVDGDDDRHYRRLIKQVDAFVFENYPCVSLCFTVSYNCEKLKPSLEDQIKLVARGQEAREAYGSQE